MNTLDAVMRFEEGPTGDGGLEDDTDFLEAAQYLIDTGLAWQLQGSFGRACAALIDAGVCQHPADA